MNDEAQETQATEEVAPEQPLKEVQEEAQVSEKTEQVEADTGTEAETSSEEESTVDPSDILQQYAQQEPYNIKQNDGYVDPNEVAAAIEQRVNQQMTQRIQEQRAWEAIDKKYPNMDKETRDIILSQRIADAVQGRKSNLNKTADLIMGRMNTAKSEGRAEAKVSTKVQKAASLETSTANQGSKSGDDIRDRIANGDKRATQDLLKDWIEKGLI